MQDEKIRDWAIILNYNSLQNKAHQKKRKTKFYIDLELKQKYWKAVFHIIFAPRTF